MPEYLGLLHAHTKGFSRDGRMLLTEAARACRQAGFSFLLLAEHAEDLDEERLTLLTQRCRELSEPDLLLVPGVEVECAGGVHLGCLGQAWIPATRRMPPGEVLAAARAAGQYTVLMHLSDVPQNLPLGGLRQVEAVEVWNARRDGRHAPTPEVFDRFSRGWSGPERPLALAGVDAHYAWEIRPPALRIEAASLTWPALLAGLKARAVRIAHPFFPLASDGRLAGMRRLEAGLINRAYRIFIRAVESWETLRA